MPWILSFDISTRNSVIVLGRMSPSHPEGKLVAWDEEHIQANQSADQLIPRIEKIITTNGISMDAIDIVACGQGPGTFTGSRVAVATAKGLALGLSRPLYGVCTLLSLAAMVQPARPVLAILYAQQNVAYCACFEHLAVLQSPKSSRLVPCMDAQCNNLEDAIHTGLARFSKSSGACILAAGFPNFCLDTQKYPQVHVQSVSGLNPGGLWHATLQTIRYEQPADIATLDAIYLRPSYAELNQRRSQ